MTIEEIDKLKMDEQVTQIIKSRLMSQLDLEPGDKPPEFSKEAYDDEFEEYKKELRFLESERVRKLNLKERFYNLLDYRNTLNVLYPDVVNPALFLVDVLRMPPNEAETRLTELEEKDLEIQNSEEMILKKFIDKRVQEYVKEGATVNGILEAIWEKVMEGDSTKADALQSKRLAVKARVPKPL